MKKTKVDIDDIQFKERILPNGNLQIAGSVTIQATAELIFEAAGNNEAKLSARYNLIDLLLSAIYGDVWDLARWAEILIKRDSSHYFHAAKGENSVIEILAVLGRIGEYNDDTERILTILEPYRNPEGRSNSEKPNSNRD